MLREAERIACGPQRVPPWYEVLKSYGTGSTATRLDSNAECSGASPAKLNGRPRAGGRVMAWAPRGVAAIRPSCPAGASAAEKGRQHGRSASPSTSRTQEEAPADRSAGARVEGSLQAGFRQSWRPDGPRGGVACAP